MVNRTTVPQGQFQYTPSYKRTVQKSCNTRVALWQLPLYDSRITKCDKDKNKWLESCNKNEDNEINDVEQNLKIDLSKYKVHSQTTKYEDYTYNVESVYPNQTKVSENHGLNYVFVAIKDKFNNLIAEKFFGRDSEDGRKVLYENIKQGKNTFTIAKVYSYNTTKNRATDVVNYAYTLLSSALTQGCKLEKEYYQLNGEEVKAEKTDDITYKVKTKEGKILTFQVE